jgi:gas vesicle protein
MAGDSYSKTIDYCNYLNDVAQGDPHGIFEQDLSLTMIGDSIFRLGSPGSYFYQFSSHSVEGIFPMMSLNEVSRFSSWRDKNLRDSNATSITEYKKCDVENNPINNASREEIDFFFIEKTKKTVVLSIDHDLKSNAVYLDFYHDSGNFSQAGLIEFTTAAEFVDQTIGLVIGLLAGGTMASIRSLHTDPTSGEYYQRQRIANSIDDFMVSKNTEMILFQKKSSSHLREWNISNDSFEANLLRNKTEVCVKNNSKPKAFQRIEAALLFEDKQHLLRQDQNRKHIPFFSNVALLSEKEKKNLIQKLFLKLTSEEQKTHFEFRTLFLNKDPNELDPLIIRDQWNIRNQENYKEQPNSCSWDALLELIQDQIHWEQRDTNSENTIQNWKELSSNVQESKSYWKGDFWSEYWPIQVFSMKAKYHEKKDQLDLLDFIEVMKEVNISLVPSLEVLKESFDRIIDSAEHLSHTWKVISDKQQVAFNNDQCLKEFPKEIFEAKQSLAYWNIEILHRKALHQEAAANYLFEKAINNDPNQKSFPHNWMIARDAILDAHASYSFFKESILKRIMEMSDQGVSNNDLQPLYEWLEEIEYKITFWENEISWSKGEEAHLIAEAAIEIYLSEEDSSSFDSNDNFYNTPDFLRYLNPVELKKIRGAILFLSTAMDMQFRACSKVALKYQKSFKDKYDLALEQINHWNELLQDHEILKFSN